MIQPTQDSSLKMSGQPVVGTVQLPPGFQVGQGIKVSGFLFEIIKIKRGKMTIRYLPDDPYLTTPPT